MDDRVAAKVQKKQKTKNAWQARSDNKLRFFVGWKEKGGEGGERREMRHGPDHNMTFSSSGYFFSFGECILLSGFGECGMFFFVLHFSILLSQFWG